MRIAHFGDLHITDGDRLVDQAATLTAIVDDILASEPDLVLVGGDLTGHTVPHDATPREQAVLFGALRRILAVCPAVVVAGNHDNPIDIANLAHLSGEWPIRVVTGAEALAVQTPSGIAHVYGLAYPWKRWLLAGEAVEGGVVGAQRAIEEKLGTILTVWAHKIRRRRASHPDEPHVGLMHIQIGGSKTSGGEVLQGQEIELSRYQLDGVPFDYVALGHLHMRQEVAHRAWYPGSPWRNDYSEVDAKGWHLVQIANVPAGGMHAIGAPGPGEVTIYGGNSERLSCYVERVPSRCRTFVTLDYRWAADHEDGAPRWITRPTEDEIAACRDAEVRMRLSVPETWVAGCPWADEVKRVSDLAVRVKEQRTVEPVMRVRAPTVAAAENPREKLRAYWGVIATPPDALEQASAMARMDELDTLDDTEIAALCAGLVS